MNQHEELKQALLKIGGVTVKPLNQENAEALIANLSKYGRVCDGPIQVIAGNIPDECHGNSLALFLFTNKLVEVWTGFALAPDGHPNTGEWTEHTWILHRGAIIETTPLTRKIYFGYPHPNTGPWAEHELKVKNMWRDDPLEYIRHFRPNSQEDVWRLAGVE